MSRGAKKAKLPPYLVYRRHVSDATHVRASRPWHLCSAMSMTTAPVRLSLNVSALAREDEATRQRVWQRLKQRHPALAAWLKKELARLRELADVFDGQIYLKIDNMGKGERDVDIDSTCR